MGTFIFFTDEQKRRAIPLIFPSSCGGAVKAPSIRA